jgi:hypothetical protein
VYVCVGGRGDIKGEDSKQNLGLANRCGGPFGLGMMTVNTCGFGGRDMPCPICFPVSTHLEGHWGG